MYNNDSSIQEKRPRKRLDGNEGNRSFEKVDFNQGNTNYNRGNNSNTGTNPNYKGNNYNPNYKGNNYDPNYRREPGSYQQRQSGQGYQGNNNYRNNNPDNRGYSNDRQSESRSYNPENRQGGQRSYNTNYGQYGNNNGNYNGNYNPNYNRNYNTDNRQQSDNGNVEQRQYGNQQYNGSQQRQGSYNQNRSYNNQQQRPNNRVQKQRTPYNSKYEFVEHFYVSKTPIGNILLIQEKVFSGGFKQYAGCYLDSNKNFIRPVYDGMYEYVYAQSWQNKLKEITKEELATYTASFTDAEVWMLQFRLEQLRIKRIVNKSLFELRTELDTLFKLLHDKNSDPIDVENAYIEINEKFQSYKEELEIAKIQERNLMSSYIMIRNLINKAMISYMLINRKTKKSKAIIPTDETIKIFTMFLQRRKKQQRLQMKELTERKLRERAQAQRSEEAVLENTIS